MENIEVTVQTILAIFGGLSVIAGGIKVIVSMGNPYKESLRRLSEAENKLITHDRLLDNDKKAIDKLELLIKDNQRVNVALLNHFIDGNGIDKMKKLREELLDDII